MSPLYQRLCAQLQGLLDGERDFIANSANCSALLMAELERLNWVGVYIERAGELVLGPFQGMPACTRIPWGSGVCGSAAAGQCSLVVPDVHAFPGHIACDAASESEIVVPLLWQGTVIGVLDLDSPHLARFDEQDRIGLEALATILLQGSDIAAARATTTELQRSGT